MLTQSTHNLPSNFIVYLLASPTGGSRASSEYGAQFAYCDLDRRAECFAAVNVRISESGYGYTHLSGLRALRSIMHCPTDSGEFPIIQRKSSYKGCCVHHIEYESPTWCAETSKFKPSMMVLHHDGTARCIDQSATNILCLNEQYETTIWSVPHFLSIPSSYGLSGQFNMSLSTDADCVVCGGTSTASDNIAVFDTDGNVVWRKNIPLAGQAMFDSQKNVISCGEAVVKTDYSGSQVWQTLFGGGSVVPTTLAVGKDDVVYVEITSESKVYALNKNDGSTLWSITAIGPITPLPNGDVILLVVSGAICRPTRYNSNGQLVWSGSSILPASNSWIAVVSAIYSGGTIGAQGGIYSRWC